MANRTKTANGECKPLNVKRLKELLEYEPDTGMFRWRVAQGKVKPGEAAGWKHSNGYVILTLDYDNYRAHRVAWLYMTGEWPADLIDHRQNADRSDNRWENLRPASKVQNGANSHLRAGSASGLKGAYFCKRRMKWYSNFTHKNKTSRIAGYFDTAQEAHEAFMKKAREINGEYARAA